MPSPSMKQKRMKQKRWNKEVEKKVNRLLTPMIKWVKKRIEEDKESTWFDKYTGERARLLLELARVEIYNDMYYATLKERIEDLESIQVNE